MLVLQFLGIVVAATFGLLCWIFPWGLSDVPSIVGTVMQTVGLLCMIGAGLYALWASAWFGAGFGSAAGWLHLVAFGACFFVIHTLVLRYWGF